MIVLPIGRLLPSADITYYAKRMETKKTWESCISPRLSLMTGSSIAPT